MRTKTHLKVSLVIAVFLVGMAPAIASGGTIYVDANASPGGNGASWGTAYKYLQDALAAAVDGNDIWVAEGTYKPDANSANPGGSGSRIATFQLINGVPLYGGFPSVGDPNWNDRDPNANEAILSGDIGTEGVSGDNSYHVVTGSGTNSTAILDGFTITAGNASGSSPHNRGGGMFNYGGSPTVVNCTFSGNSTSYSGGGMYNDEGSNPTVTNCTFSGNSADDGGGMSNRYSDPTVINCTFSGNSAGDCGGGMCNIMSSPTVTNCILWGNTASSSGPQIYNEYKTPTVTYSDVQGGYTGMGNINADPCFVDADGPDDIVGTEDDNLRLLFGSPCIDAGDNTAVPGGVTTDLDGNPRFVDDPGTTDTGNGTPPIVDMGAYEYQPIRTLTISSTSGGTVSEPGEGSFQYVNGTVVPIIAQAEVFYVFVEWTGTAVEAGKVADPNAASTTVTMDADYTLLANFVRPPTILHVDTDASGGGDGSSWATAFEYLQDALAAAVTNDEIWVAEGTYKPDEDTANPGGTGNRTTTFQLINGVAIYGGFAGNETTLDERDWETNETILSGDLDGNDVPVGDPCDLPTEPTRAENSYHVVTGSGTDANAVLDGFTITAGNANSSYPNNHGGGMYNNSGSPTVTNCLFSRNSAAMDGGGMYNNVNSSPTVTNCTFSGNSAEHWGGGMYSIEYSSPTLSNCTFSGNSADAGGGMYNQVFSDPTLTNCTFSGNSASDGGGMYNGGGGCSPTVTNCTFSGNSAGQGGGMYSYSSSPILTNCTFSRNSAGVWGGGMLNHSSSPTVTNCTFSGNDASAGGGMVNWTNSSPTVTNCILWGNTAPSAPQIYNDGTSSATVSYSDVQGGYGGTGNIATDPLFIDADGPDNIPGTEDDNLHLLGYSPCINAGDPAGNYTGQVDVDNQPRVAYGRVDMGVDEVFPIAGDFEPDGDVDFKDFARFANHWLLGVE